MTHTSKPAVQALISAANRAWREKRLRDLARMLHPDVVFLGPQLQMLAEGRDACLRSYSDFIAEAKVHRFEEKPAVVHVTGATAVATYEWSIAYSLGGARYEETGREALVCTLSNSGWQIVWRAQFPQETKKT
jgi:uncharacterized protein (TIGR02246 family)